MEALELVLLLLAAVLISSVLDQIIPKVSRPLIQIGMGLLIAIFANSTINIEWNSELFLLLFIAPLLYDEARNINLNELWENRNPVLSLAIGLVITSTLVVGFLLHGLIPSIPLAVAFALGAALGPTDAVAVASLPSNVNIGDRRRNILKGESLINDASGIVCFQFAIAFTVYGDFSASKAVLTFFIMFFGGILVGLLFGWVANFITQFVRELGLENTTFHVLFDLFIPFLVYLAAEAIEVSGILAVVCAGLYLSASNNRAISPKASRLNIVSTSVWRVFTFALNGVVFVLLGTQLPKAMQTTWDNLSLNNIEIIGYALLLTVLVVAVRFVWVYGMEYVTHRQDGIALFNKQTLRSAAIMTLGGPKGAITLSIMFTIPIAVEHGGAFPQRELIIFLACCVILFTLALSCFAVPLFAEKRNQGTSKAASQTAMAEAQIEVLRHVTEELTARQTPDNRRATQTVIHQYNKRITRIKNRADLDDSLNVNLRLRAIGWEKDYIESLRDEGKIDEMVAYDILSTLESQEELLVHHTDLWTTHSKLHRPRIALRTRWRNMRKRLPVLSVSEEEEQRRLARIGSLEHAIARLKEVVSGDRVPTEDATAVLLEYQRNLGALRSKSSTQGITGMTRTMDKAEAVKRLAYNLELEAIQDMYEEGRISRAYARTLRENVNLMQIDLENCV